MANDITITRNSNTKNARLIKLIGKWWLLLSVLQRSLLHVHWFTALKVANSSWMASKSLFSASWELSPSDPSSVFYNITMQWKVLSIQLITPKGNLPYILIPISDQDRISPHNINTISSKQVTRMKKNLYKGIISWSNTKVSQLTS